MRGILASQAFHVSAAASGGRPPTRGSLHMGQQLMRRCESSLSQLKQNPWLQLKLPVTLVRCVPAPIGSMHTAQTSPFATVDIACKQAYARRSHGGCTLQWTLKGDGRFYR